MSEQGMHFTPKLQSGDASGLANGTLTGHIDDDETRIDLRVGHRTTFEGDAPIWFEMPDGIALEDCTGRVVALDVSCNQVHWGIARVEGRSVHLFAEDGNTWTPHVPFTLAPGDTIQIVLPWLSKEQIGRFNSLVWDGMAHSTAPTFEECAAQVLRRMPEHLVHALACEAYMLSPIARRVVDDRARVVNAEPDNLS